MWRAFWCTTFAVETAAQHSCYHAADPQWSPLASPCCHCLSSGSIRIKPCTTFMPSHQHQQTRWSSPGWREARDLRIAMDFHQIAAQKWQITTRCERHATKTTLRPRCDAIMSPWGKTNGENMINWHSQEFSDLTKYNKQIQQDDVWWSETFPFTPLALQPNPANRIHGPLQCKPSVLQSGQTLGHLQSWYQWTCDRWQPPWMQMDALLSIFL